VSDGANGFEVDEDNGVGFREKARGFRRGDGAEIEHGSQGAEKENGDEEGNQRAFAHEPFCGEGTARGVLRVECRAGGGMGAVAMQTMLPVLRSGLEWTERVLMLGDCGDH
jgi:hypothetical protein